MPRKRKSKQKFKEGKFTLRPTGRAYLSLKNKWIGIKIVLPTIAIKYMIIDYYNVEIIIIIIIILLQKEWEKETSKRKKKKGRKEWMIKKLTISDNNSLSLKNPRQIL